MGKIKSLNSKKRQRPKLPSIEYNQPSSSPYELPFASISIGNASYGIPKCHLQKFPALHDQLGWNSELKLDVDEDVGHTLVHFLYSGLYETLDSPLGRGESFITREYKRNILVYKAARKYNLPDLEAFAKKYIEHFGNSLSIFDILRTTSKVFSEELLTADTWFCLYLRRCLEHLFKSDRSAFTNDEFYSALEDSIDFLKAIVRMAFDIFSAGLQLSENASDSHQQPIANREITANGGVMKCDLPVHFATYPARYCPKEAPPALEPAEVNPEVYPEEPPAAESCEKYSAPEPAPDEPAAAEPTEEYSIKAWPEEAPPAVEPVEDYPEVYPEAPPAAEDCEELPAAVPTLEEPDSEPTEEYPIEAWPEVAPPAPEPVEEYSEVYPEEPPAAESCEKYSAPEPAPEELASAPTEEYPMESCPKEALASKDHLSNDLADVTLYAGWETLSSKRRLWASMMLRRRGLPVPDQNGRFPDSVKSPTSDESLQVIF